MRNDRLRQQFSAQFRDEEGLLVFRYRQRGIPIEVSVAEHERAIARFVDLNRIAGRVAIGSIVLAIIVFVYVLPKEAASTPMIVVAYLAIVASWAAMTGRAWNEPTRNWRDRLPVGERLGWFGAHLMRLDRTHWRQLLAGTGVSAMIFYLLADGTGPLWTIIASGLATLGLGATVVIKLGLGERRRWREKKRLELRRARDIDER